MAAIWSRRASTRSEEAKNKANEVLYETKPNDGKSMADKIDQLGRRLITMDDRSERTERKLDQLTEEHTLLRKEVHELHSEELPLDFES